ncbi:MAG: hypothetical protein QM655_13515, partial [Nocardioidaceae bacterium]
MDTLKDDLELAIPRIDAGDDRLDTLIRAGRQAVRQRRARIGGALTAGGLVVAGLALGATAMLAQDAPGPDGNQPLAIGPGATRSVTAELTLASLQEVADTCGEVTVDPATKTLTSGGQAVTPTDQLKGDGWVAVEYPCGSDVVRVLQFG